MSLTINGEQYEEGDEVAVTFVGKVYGDILDGPGVSLYVGNSLRYAVDAYKIGPDPQVDDLVQDDDGTLWQFQADGYWHRQVVSTNRRRYIDSATPVKVVAV